MKKFFLLGVMAFLSCMTICAHEVVQADSCNVKKQVVKKQKSKKFKKKDFIKQFGTQQRKRDYVEPSLEDKRRDSIAGSTLLKNY